MKKKILYLLVSIVILTNSFAQNKSAKIDFGIKVLGSASFAIPTFTAPNSIIRFIEPNIGYGFSGGLYLGIPLFKKLSIQPEILFHGIRMNDFSLSLFNKARSPRPLEYYGLSVPLLLKFLTTKHLSIYAGATGNYYFELIDLNTLKTLKKDNKRWNIAATAGLEWRISNRFKINARYHYGFTTLLTDEYSEPKDEGVNFIPQYIELGFALQLTRHVPTIKNTYSDRYNENAESQTEAKREVLNIATIDSDNDGIVDMYDRCISVKGVPEYKGCPAPVDSDKDGIPDKEDKCPTEFGQKRFKGCAAPSDTDGDGIPDSDDKCPTIYGVVSHQGCKEVSEEVKEALLLSLKGIQFDGGSSILTQSSYPILNNLGNILAKNPHYKLYIIGHSDGSGSLEYNFKLSNERASAVQVYLLTRGIAANRLITKSYGATKLLIKGSTPLAKEINRRVELSIVIE